MIVKRDLVLYQIRYHLAQPAVRISFVAMAFILFCSLTLLIAWWFPQHREYLQVQRENALLEKDVVALIKKQNLAMDYRNTRQLMAGIEEKLDADTSQSSLTKNTSNLATHYNIRIVKEASENGRDTAGFIPHYQTLSLEGDYRGLRGFVNALNELPTLTAVVSGKISRDKGEGSVLSATLTLVTYKKSRGPNS